MNQEQHVEINNTIESLDNSIKVATELRDKLLKEVEDSKTVKSDENINIIDRIKGRYCYIDVDFDILYTNDDAYESDDRKFNTFNYFPTEEIAQKVSKRELLSRKVLLGRDKARNNWTPINQDRDFCELIYDADGITLKSNVSFDDSRTTLTFKDVEQIALFRKMITDEEIINYLNI